MTTVIHVGQFTTSPFPRARNVGLEASRMAAGGHLAAGAGGDPRSPKPPRGPDEAHGRGLVHLRAWRARWEGVQGPLVAFLRSGGDNIPRPQETSPGGSCTRSTAGSPAQTGARQGGRDGDEFDRIDDERDLLTVGRGDRGDGATMRSLGLGGGPSGRSGIAGRARMGRAVVIPPPPPSVRP